MDQIIDFKNVTVRYGATEALAKLAFSLEKGDFLGLVGPNGGGKTTLVRAIFGLATVDEGDITLFGTPQKKFSEWYRIGYLPQKHAPANPLFPATAEEAVLTGLLSKLKMPKFFTKEHKEKVCEVFGALGITDLAEKMLTDLSGGQAQRVMLARALVSDPEILIFDEPSTALDPDSRESFFKLIKTLNAEKGVTIVLITHDTGYVGKYATKMLYLDKRAIYHGTFGDFCHSVEMGQYFGPHDQHIICHQHQK